MQDLFKDKGIVIKGIRHLSPKESYQAALKDAVIIDIREDFETIAKVFSVPNLRYYPNSKFKETYHNLPFDVPLIIADSVGLRSKEAVLFLQEKGYKNIANLNGGIVDWEKDKLPMVIDKNEMLTGSCLCQLRPKKRFNKK